MRRALSPLLAAAALALALPLSAGKAVPPSPSSYVHNEGVVSPQTAERLSRLLREVEVQTGRQFVVALFQGLDGESLEDYSNQVFRAWRIGDAKKNDGLLFCLFLKDRRWRVEVGYGLEGTLTDLEAGEIARDAGVPHFKAGDYDSGVAAVAESLAAKIGWTGARTAPRAPRPSAGGASLWPILLFLVVLLLGIAVLIEVLRGETIGRRGRSSSSGWDWSSGGGGSSGGSSDFGGFSGGGGSSGGGGASGSW